MTLPPTPTRLAPSKPSKKRAVKKTRRERRPCSRRHRPIGPNVNLTVETQRGLLFEIESPGIISAGLDPSGSSCHSACSGSSAPGSLSAIAEEHSSK